MILRAYKTELDPTAAQRRELGKHVAAARLAHNWALEKWREYDAARGIAMGARALADVDALGGEIACWFGYAMSAWLCGEPVKVRTPKGETQRHRYRHVPGVQIPDFKSGRIDWYAQLVATRDEQPERFGWFSEVSAFAVREAVLDVEDGWKHFFEHLKAGRFEKAGPPKFRSWRKARYHADQPDPIRTTDRAVKIPSIGWVRLKERGYLPSTEENSHRFTTGGKACGLGLSEKDGRWYVALRCEVPTATPGRRAPGRVLRERMTPRIPGRRMGVENGVRVLAVGYDGEASEAITEPGLRDDSRIESLVRLRKLWERRMARRWRSGVSTRDQSVGWREASRRVAHYHARIVQVRDDRVGKVVRRIVDRGAETVLLREPHVAKLLDRRTAPDARTRNKLAPYVHGARMGDLRERIEYKQRWAGGAVELVDKFEPVTRRCSICGTVRAEPPSYPAFKCPSCGHTEDRDDANAPRNLYNYSGGSSSGEAGPRSAGLKPSTTSVEEDKGREKRMSRPPPAKAGVGTDPYRSGNRARPGAPHSMRPNDPHHQIELERISDTQTGSPQSRGDTALPEADDRDRSQTVLQVAVMATGVRGASESIQ